MRTTPIVVVAFVAALAATTSAGAATITGLYDTGVNSSGTPLSDGTIGDPHYSLVAVPGGTSDIRVRTSAGGFPIGPYIGDDALSAWIGPNNDSQIDGPGGIYDYRTTFSVTNPLIASIFGQWSSDNAGIEIEINGVDTGNLMNPYGPPSSYSFSHWVPFSITSGFLSGVNTLDFIVMNGNGSTDTTGPTALRLEISSTPLPAALPLFAGGLGILGLVAGRKRRKVATTATV